MVEEADSKLLIILSTAEREKALTGLMYAKNAIEQNWIEDIQVIFFGPIENLMLEDEEVREYAEAIADQTECVACKYLSDRDEISEDIEELGMDLDYVGSIISDYIKEGYVPMVW
ncbi:MAG: hypothetical protein V5A66_05020 [Candidatus Thermoplasmatota archaeon]